MTSLDPSSFTRAPGGARRLLRGAMLAATFAAISAPAEEGAIGHYTPGLIATRADGAPTLPNASTLSFQFDFYDGALQNSPVPIAGALWLDFSRKVYTVGTLGFTTFRERFLGSTYSMGFALPFTWLEASAIAQVGNVSGRIEDSASSFGDLMLIPAALNWGARNIQYQFLLPIYAPTGAYSAGRLANIGRNTWGFEPTFGVRYQHPDSLVEMTAYAALGFTTENPDTSYRSGNLFHLDATFAKHDRLGMGEQWGAGITGYYYEQFTDDTGPLVPEGGFRGRAAGLGPVLSYSQGGPAETTVFELKWISEFGTRHRTSGNVLWIKARFVF